MKDYHKKMAFVLWPMMMMAEGMIHNEEELTIETKTSDYHNLKLDGNLYVLRAKTEPFDFIEIESGILWFTMELKNALRLNKKQAKEILKKNPHLKMVKISHLPLRTLLKKK